MQQFLILFQILFIQEYTCPICACGFIEELPADRVPESNPDVEMQEDPHFVSK